jgi:hypothetical protein
MRAAKQFFVLILLPISLLLSSCAHNPAQARQGRLIRMRPYGSGYGGSLEGYTKENYPTSPSRPPRAIASQAPLTQAGEYAPIIKSQQYAQVPRQILQMGEIHNIDSYSPPTQEVQFDLVPVTAFPRKGYYPNPNKAYVPDTVVAPGQKEGTEEAPTPGQSRIQRRLITVQSEGQTITGYARTLGIISRDQRAQAEHALVTADGEEPIYINGIGWVAIIPQN